MKLPRPRFSVRRLMIAVAVVALALRAVFWVAQMRARSAIHEARAGSFVLETMRGGSVSQMSDGRAMKLYDDENLRRKDEWAIRMAEKYYRLSDYPWLPVEPDPPRPLRLEHPKKTFELPARKRIATSPNWGMARYWHHPAWTFLWTRLR